MHRAFHTLLSLGFWGMITIMMIAKHDSLSPKGARPRPYLTQLLQAAIG
jgi:hypothetical protein